MPWTSDHLTWLVDTGQPLKTADGLNISTFELRHENDELILAAWAKHFRNNYCLDTEIDILRGKTPRSDYLKNSIFPCHKTCPGPSVRAGDFAEILIADYVEFQLGFWVPRIRWRSKVVRNESVKGCDVVGFRLGRNGKPMNDEMIIFECKAQFSTGKKSVLQNAINDSAKDELRIAETLNFLKRRFAETADTTRISDIERFQNPNDQPYTEKYAAAAVITRENFDPNEIRKVDASKIPTGKKGAVKTHPHRKKLQLIVISGSEMMRLANELYRRAADAA